MSADAETRVQELCRAGNSTAALALTVRTYGAEVYGFVVSRLRDEATASDVFGEACADLCTSIATFEFRCSIRTWMYHLARSALSRHLRSPHNAGHRRISLSEVSEVAERVRTETRDYLRTEVKDQFAELREELELDDQMLLTLRVDRELEWGEVAQILRDDALSPEEVLRESARLRQRFKSVKEQLARRATEIGLISDG